MDPFIRFLFHSLCPSAYPSVLNVTIFVPFIIQGTDHRHRTFVKPRHFDAYHYRIYRNVRLLLGTDLATTEGRLQPRLENPHMCHQILHMRPPSEFLSAEFAKLKTTEILTKGDAWTGLSKISDTVNQRKVDHYQ